MAVKVAINGFGRIGRLVLRAIVESGRTDVEPVAINDLGSVEANAHMFRYDSVHGRFPGTVEVVDGHSLKITLNGRSWGPIRVSAPADGVDATIVFGVNDKTMTKEMTVISNASCTTNCLAPMAKVLHEKFGILRGYMVTIHAYTGDQNTVDTLHT